MTRREKQWLVVYVKVAGPEPLEVAYDEAVELYERADALDRRAFVFPPPGQPKLRGSDFYPRGSIADRHQAACVLFFHDPATMICTVNTIMTNPCSAPV